MSGREREKVETAIINPERIPWKEIKETKEITAKAGRAPARRTDKQIPGIHEKEGNQ